MIEQPAYYRAALSGTDYGERTRRHRARDRITSRPNAIQYSTKRRELLASYYILLSMSVIVEGESSGF